jgi:putative protease
MAKDADFNMVSVQIPQGEKPNDLNKMKQNLINQISKAGNSDFYVENVEICDDEFPFLPVSKLNALRRELLSLLMNERLANFKRLPQKPISYKPFLKSKMDYHANVYNSEAKTFYEKCNCAISELALETFDKIPSGIELMRTKHCLKFATDLCGKPSNKIYLVDNKGKKYPLKFDCKNCEMVILNP